MTCGHVTRPTREHRQSTFQSRQQRTKRQYVHPRCGKLEGEREAVETAADRIDRLVLDERGIDSTSSLDEEGDRIGGAQRLHREALFSGQAEWLAAGDEDVDRGARGEQ